MDRKPERNSMILRLLLWARLWFSENWLTILRIVFPSIPTLSPAESTQNPQSTQNAQTSQDTQSTQPASQGRRYYAQSGSTFLAQEVIGLELNTHSDGRSISTPRPQDVPQGVTHYFANDGPVADVKKASSVKIEHNVGKRPPES